MTRWAGLFLVGLMVASAGLALTPAIEQYVPSVAHAQGQIVNGVRAQWRSDVWVFNPSSEAAAVDIFLLLRDQANPNPEVRQVTVNPGETRYFPDIVLSLFNHEDAGGALRVVSNVAVEGGTVRISIRLTTPACPSREAIATAVREAVGKKTGSRVEVTFSSEVARAPGPRERLAGVGGGADLEIHLFDVTAQDGQDLQRQQALSILQ